MIFFVSPWLEPACGALAGRYTEKARFRYPKEPVGYAPKGPKYQILAPLKVPQLRALCSLFDVTWCILAGNWGVLVSVMGVLESRFWSGVDTRYLGYGGWLLHWTPESA